MTASPRATAAVTALGAGIIGIALAPIVGPVVLGIVGFSSGGVVAGSMAAGIQSGIGNVVAGSAFAGAQSVAAGGAMPAIGTAISAGLSAMGGYFSMPKK